MAATNSTTNYGLPQWVATDKPERTDFNTAMADIDTNINLVQSGDETDWTPVLLNFNGTYTSRIGKYIKRGNEVTVFARIEVNTASFSTGSQLAIGGFPFNFNPLFPTCVPVYIFPKSVATQIPIAISLTTGSYGNLYIYRQEVAILTIFPQTSVVNGTVIQFSFTYRVE